MATTTYTFLDTYGRCILRIPGVCVYYSGNYQPCGSISNGTQFNEVVKRLVSCVDASFIGFTTSTSSTTSTTTTTLSTSSTTTTTTTTLSTSSTSTTTTTSTTNSTTSSTSTTSTSTTTTSTTPFTMPIYWGAQSSSTPPNSGQAVSQSTNSQNPSGDVVADFTSFNGSPQYCWVCIPAAYPKTKWFDTVINQGTIGGGGDLFTTFGPITISAVSYTIIMTQYQTQFSETTAFKA